MADEGDCGIDGGETSNQKTKLQHALLQNDFDTFKMLLCNGTVDLEGQPVYTNYGQELLKIASNQSFGRPFVKLLLQSGVAPNFNRIVQEPIHIAALGGFDEVLEELVQDKRTKVNAYDSMGRTALHYACKHVEPQRLHNYENCVKMLMNIFSPQDVNRTDVNGHSAIHVAMLPPRRESISKEGLASEIKNSSDDEIQAARNKLLYLMLQLGRDILDIDSITRQGKTTREILAEIPEFMKIVSDFPNQADTLKVDPHSALMDALVHGQIYRFKKLLQKTAEEGEPQLDPNHWFGSPHNSTCLEMACKKPDGVEYIAELIKAGADPNIPNKLDEKFPIHFACEKGLYENLKALFHHSPTTNPNTQDRFGNTVLHFIVNKWNPVQEEKANEYHECLIFLLSLENIDINRKNHDGVTPILLALESNMKIVVQIIIEQKASMLDLSTKFKGREVREILKEIYPDLAKQLTVSFSPQIENTRNELFHFLYKMQEDEFIEFLLKQGDINLSIDDGEFTLLQRSASNGMERAVKTLLTAKANPNDSCDNNKCPPVILAICKHHYRVVRLFLEEETCDVNATDSKGNNALYYSTKNLPDPDAFEITLRLLECGANPNLRNKYGKNCFDRDRLQLLLDLCIQTNGTNLQDEDYEIIVNYRLLALTMHHEVKKNELSEEETVRLRMPDTDQRKIRSPDNEMYFLHLMSHGDLLKSLLEHPVGSSFLQMKWNRISRLFHFNLAIYIAFVLCLNMYIINSGAINPNLMKPRSSNDSDKSENKVLLLATKSYPSILLTILTFLLWLYLLVREIMQITLIKKQYFKEGENILDIAILLFSFFAISIPILEVDYSFISLINVVAIMLSCAELLLLLGRLPRFAKYIEMLKIVMNNYIWPLMSYFVIIIAFGLSFHALLHKPHRLDGEDNPQMDPSNTTHFQSSFHPWYMAIVNSLVMMTGAFEIDTFAEHSFMAVILFLFFVLLVTVILLNLLIGLAVSDIQKIEADATQLLLKTRVHVVQYVEIILVNLHNSNFWFFRKLQPCFKVFLLFPEKSVEKKKGRVLPTQSANICLSDQTVGLEFDREWLERVVQIINTRSKHVATLDFEMRQANIETKLDEIITLFKSFHGEKYVLTPENSLRR